MSNPKITKRKLADYHPSDINPNQHTERGLQVIEDSINYNGAGRSGLVANDGTFIAGHGTWEAMARAGIEEVVEVEIDGHQWVVVKRADLDGNVINSRSAVSISGLSTSNTIVLSGADLAIGEAGRVREFLVEYTYTSSLGSGLLGKDACRFTIQDFVAVT